MMSYTATAICACALMCGVVHAADKKSVILSKATEQYAKCLDNTLGNFAYEDEAKVAARRISRAMLRNIRELVTEERKSPSSTTQFWIETLGEEAFIGYLFKSFSDVDEEYRIERRGLKEKNKGDWRKTEQLLWSKYGCEAIYSQMPS